jgi:hypothetical protein
MLTTQNFEIMIFLDDGGVGTHYILQAASGLFCQSTSKFWNLLTRSFFHTARHVSKIQRTILDGHRARYRTHPHQTSDLYAQPAQRSAAAALLAAPHVSPRCAVYLTYSASRISPTFTLYHLQLLVDFPHVASCTVYRVSSSLCSACCSVFSSHVVAMYHLPSVPCMSPTWQCITFTLCRVQYHFQFSPCSVYFPPRGDHMSPSLCSVYPPR